MVYGLRMKGYWDFIGEATVVCHNSARTKDMRLRQSGDFGLFSICKSFFKAGPL